MASRTFISVVPRAARRTAGIGAVVSPCVPLSSGCAISSHVATHTLLVSHTLQRAHASLLGSRCFSSAAATSTAASATAASTPEARMETILRSRLSATHVSVVDVSGGCGSFYRVIVVSPTFEGQSVVKQHRAVNAVLEQEIGKMHGLTLTTFTPSAWAKASEKAA